VTRGDPVAGNGRGRPSAHCTGTDGEDGLARALSRLARDLQHESGAQAVMDRIVATAAAMVPGAQEATISLVHGRRRVVTAAATSPRARRLDECQQATGQGPCMDAMYEQQTLRVDDLAGEHERWPDLARGAGQADIRSLLCFQLFVHGSHLGGLNLMSAEPGAFSDASEEIGLLFASHAAVAVADAHQIEDLFRALATRDVIGQAKGVLMERFKINASQAFALLAKASQDTNRRVHEVAEELTRTGSLEP
jgi:GAF domain-containing protein